jgi:hypothetical protein
MSLLAMGAVRGFGIVTPVVSVSAETSIAEGGAMLYLENTCLDLVQKIDDDVVCL